MIRGGVLGLVVAAILAPATTYLLHVEDASAAALIGISMGWTFVVVGMALGDNRWGS